MKKYLPIWSLMVLLSIQACSVFKTNLSAEQKVTNSQSKTIVQEAPQESLIISNEFVDYILRDKPDIAKDQEAQNRWLSESLRKKLAKSQETYQLHKKENPDSPEQPPGNRSFVGSWDYPTEYKIEGSRLYNERAIVDITFSWGMETNYPGDTRLVSYIFRLEEGKWKLDDIYTFRGEFVPASSLSEEFEHPFP